MTVAYLVSQWSITFRLTFPFYLSVRKLREALDVSREFALRNLALLLLPPVLPPTNNFPCTDLRKNAGTRKPKLRPRRPQVFSPRNGAPLISAGAMGRQYGLGRVFIISACGPSLRLLPRAGKTSWTIRCQEARASPVHGPKRIEHSLQNHSAP